MRLSSEHSRPKNQEMILAQVQHQFQHPSGLSLQAVHLVLRGVHMKMTTPPNKNAR